MSVPTNETNHEAPVLSGTPGADELNEDQLDEVSGGLNPQPEPPGRRLDH